MATAGPIRAADSLESGLAFAPGKKQRIDYQESGANGYRRVRDVERRERPTADIDLYEVDHIAEPDPVHQVADRATQDQGKPC